MISPTRTTIAWNFVLVLAALALMNVAESAADLYTGITEQASPNFSIATGTDASGRIPVDANWNTNFVQTPPHPPSGQTSTITGAADVFHGAAGVSYNLYIGPNADLFNVGFADDGDSQFHFTPSTDAFLILMDGASATSRSVIANHGSIGTTYYNPDSGKGGSASTVAYIQNTDFTNYGSIGYSDNSTDTTYLSTLAVQLGPNSSFTNYGTVHSSNGVYVPTSSLSSISGTQENNYGLIYTKGGSALEGNGIINNFSTGQLQDGTSGSYGVQLYVGAKATNWGLINFYTNAVYMAQNTTTFDDYGGPLFPGSYMKVPAPAGYKGYSSGCTLAFHGALGASYNSVDPAGIANQMGQLGGSVGITGINAGKSNILSLHSTVYTITADTPDHVTSGGANVLYLPIVTGAIWAGDFPNNPETANNSTVNLDLEGITAGDRGVINDAIDPNKSTTGYSYYETYDAPTSSTNGVKTFTADLNVGQARYDLYNVRHLNLLTPRTNNPVPVPAAYSVGVYHGTPTARVYYPDVVSHPTPTPPATPIPDTPLKTNPATLTLMGSTDTVALAAGTTYIEAGHVLQLGAMTFEPLPTTDNGNTTSRARNGVGNYPQANLANCTAIYIDSGTATANGFNIDGVTQTSQSPPLSLPGTLVIDNQSIEADRIGTRTASSVTTVLPPLQGSGQFVQQGTGTVTLTKANTLSGTIFIPRGTLQFASGATLPNVGGVVMGTYDTSYDGIQAAFDLSAGTPKAVSGPGLSLQSGFVFPFLTVLEAQETPASNNTLAGRINLGANNLIIGNPAAGAAPANSSFLGRLSGTGALEVAGNTTLQWGGSIDSFNDYSGGTFIDPGAVVQVSTFPRYLPSTVAGHPVQPYYMFGTGNLTNNGTLETVGGCPQVGVPKNDHVPSSSQYVQANVSATDSGGNHVIYVNGNYTQGTGGSLVLNVNSSLLASGGTPSAAGIASDYLNVGGTLTLNSNAYLTLNDLQPTALTQPATIVIAQAGSGMLGGANIFTSGTTGVPLYEGTILQVGINSAVIHYGTLSNYPRAITLTLFPTGFNAWVGTDIGAVGLAGSASYGNGSYTVNGSGTDIWNSTDAFQFVEQPLVGDGAISARVASVSNPNGWAKAGVMIRNSLAPGAPYFAAFMTPSFGLTIQWRTTNGGSSSNFVYSSATTPYWVKVARVGNIFSAYRSQDGVNWTLVGSAVTITGMGNVASAGLAVTSHDNTKLCKATFDSVNILPGAAWSSSDIGAPGLAGFTSYSNGLLTVEAGGTNLWGTSDQFRFVYQPVSGDCDIIAEVADVADTNPRAKAGVMIRETLASNSPHYFLFATPEQGVLLQSRADPAGSGSAYLKQDATLDTPRYLRLKRSGSTLTAYTSTDGINWTGFTTITNLTLSTNAYVGIALTGSNADTLGAAEFSSISVSP